MKMRRQIRNPGIRFARGATGPYARVTNVGPARAAVLGAQNQLGSPVLEFSDISEWTIEGSAGTVWQETKLVRVGSGSLRFSISGTGDRYATKNVTFDMSQSRGLWLSIYKDKCVLSGITIYLSPEENMGSGSGRWFITGSLVRDIREGWNLVFIQRSEFQVLDGAPSWNDPIRSVRFRIDGAAGIDRSFIADGMWNSTLCQKAKVSITMDDGFDTVYTNAASYANSKGIPITSFIIPDLVGNAGYMTTSQINELYDAGNDIAGHHQTNFSTIPEANISPTIKSVVDYLKSNNWTRAVRHFSWPNGEYGDTNTNWQAFYDACTDNEINRAYSIEKGIFCTALGWENGLNLPRTVSLNENATLQDAKDAVDLARDNGGKAIFYGHKIDTTADSLTWTISDWQQLIDYLEAERNVEKVNVTGL